MNYLSKRLCENCGEIAIASSNKSGLCTKCYKKKWLAERPGYQKKWREKNPNYTTEWYAKNLEKRRAYHKKWRDENPEKVRAKMKKWRAKNPDKVRELYRRVRVKKRKRVLAMFDTHCVCCGLNDFRCLRIDHINGNGRKDRQHFANTNAFYSYLLALPEKELNKNYQCLCANHNAIKQYENKEYSRGRYAPQELEEIIIKVK